MNAGCLRCRGIPVLLGWLLSLAAACPGAAQPAQVDYNRHYRFPLSVGVEYQSLSPFAAYGADYNIFDLSGTLHWPLPPLPMLQPVLRVGMMRFDNQTVADSPRWDHTHWYGALGMAYAHRFAKSFEIAGEVLAGFSEGVFPELLPEEGTVGTSNLLFELGARIALDPSYNLSIGVHPNLKYLLGLGPLEDLNGFLFGIGFSAAYRFGQDPDAARAIIRSIRFEEVTVPAVFAAMQSYYVKNPIGMVTLTNTDRQSISDVEVSFVQAGYMDSPTPAGSIPQLKGGESRSMQLFASYNQEVFRTEGVTPLTGEVIVRYRVRDRAAEQRQPVSYDLHDKTAVIWDDDRKVGAFITPADSALRNYVSFVRQSCKDEVLGGYSEPLQLAVQIFQALTEIGCLYQADPALPFVRVQEDPRVVDSISLPRDTLKRITGDCDDLTVLFCSLLEVAGVETGFITVPGHIYAAFNTKLPAREFQRLHPERSMSINLEGELWAPVEITLIGKTGFPEAWRTGAEEWVAYDNRPEKRVLYRTRAAQELYRSVGLREADLGLQYGRKERIVEGFRRDLDHLIEAVLNEQVKRARDGGRREDYNRLAIRYAQLGRYAQAESAFNQALRLDPQYLSARINLGNLLVLRKEYPAALVRLQEAHRELERTGQGQSETALKVLLNLSRVHGELQQLGPAQEYLALALAIDRDGAERFARLSEPAGGEARAAAGRDLAREILFVEEE